MIIANAAYGNAWRRNTTVERHQGFGNVGVARMQDDGIVNNSVLVFKFVFGSRCVRPSKGHAPAACSSSFLTGLICHLQNLGHVRVIAATFD